MYVVRQEVVRKMRWQRGGREAGKRRQRGGKEVVRGGKDVASGGIKVTLRWQMDAR